MKTTPSETEVIAIAVNKFVKKRYKQKLNNIIVDSVTRLAMSGKPGWKVYFVFDKPDIFSHTTFTFEVDIDGEIRVFLNM